MIQGKLEPGEGTAVDQFEVVKKGRLFSTRGRERSSDQYVGGTLFVDIASGRVRCYYQQSLGADETVQSKLKYEREARQYGVFIKHYHSDNGIFTAAAFQNELQKQDQTLRLAGVGAHHQNGCAERAIRTVVTRARALLLHAMLRWPDVTTPDLWPMAMQHAELLCNHIPKKDTGYSPLQLFSRQVKALKDEELLSSLPVWGCPVYVLEPTLQDARKLPKWQPRSRRGQYMGLSPFHASNVALVRNLHTGSIGPQYHVVYDNWFETVHVDGSEPPPEWEVLVTNSRYHADFEEDDLGLTLPHLDDEWLTKEEINATRARIQREREKMSYQSPRMRPPQRHMKSPQVIVTVVDRAEGTEPQSEVGDVLSRSTEQPSTKDVVGQSDGEHAPLDTVIDSSLEPDPDEPMRDEDSPLQPQSNRRLFQEDAPYGQTRSGRRYKAMMAQAVRAHTPEEGILAFFAMSDRVSEIIDITGVNKDSTTAAALYRAMLATDPVTGMPDDWAMEAPNVIAWALKARKSNDPDTPTFGEAMRSQNREEFIKAMDLEVNDLVKHETWQTVLRSSLPEGANVIPGTWAFKIKRLPDATIAKFKARFCVRGDRQVEGIDVFETFAPVVAWPTVRCLLAFALRNNLATRQVDFSNAFVQSKLPPDEQVFVEVPKGYSDPDGQDVVLQLNKSLYGMRQSPFHWFNTIKSSLLHRDFKQSEEDPCMFHRDSDGMILLLYVDDVILLNSSEEAIDDFIDDLRHEFDLSAEQVDQDAHRTVYQFLGIELIDQKSVESDIHSDDETISHTNRSRSIMLRQTKLIDNILRSVNMMECKPDATPAHETPLGMDRNGPPFNEDWEYSSVVGKLLYLVNTRPDIQFAVHQCARFTHSPKASHAVAVKRICRYLKGTRNRGLVYKPDSIDGHEIQLDAYVDADFSGLYGIEDSQDPVSSRSRTGFVFLLGNCPVVWKSSLQSETALSTVEAEYIALSTAMRELIPLRRLVKEIAGVLDVRLSNTIVKSTVFEDNMGCIQVVQAPKMTARTKHINLKYHFFRSHIGKDKGIEIKHVASSYQLADIFTKGLDKELFTHLCDLLMGWNTDLSAFGLLANVVVDNWMNSRLRGSVALRRQQSHRMTAVPQEPKREPP